MYHRLSPEQNALHEMALELSRKHRQIEWKLVETLQKIEQTRLYRNLGFPSLFQYAVRALGLTESVAYSFISVSRKASEISELKEALKAQLLSVNKAGRLVSAITPENAAGLVQFAKDHTLRELDFETARLNPKAGPRERVKPLAQDQVELRINVSRQTFEGLKRAQDLVAQKKGKHFDLASTLTVLLDEYLKHHDPVEKAGRARVRESIQDREKLCAHRVQSGKQRVSLKAREKHAVNARDGGRCTFRDATGQRCTNERWLHLHHLRPVSHGGGNDPTNLTTLCSFHHDLVHQLSLPMEGEVHWANQNIPGV